MSLGTVAALRRYPVKSLRGEDLDRMEVDERGPVGDRLWALVDERRQAGQRQAHERAFARWPDCWSTPAAWTATCR